MKPFERQTTLAEQVTLTGVGVHKGKSATVSVLPAPANTGIVFSTAGDFELQASCDAVVSTALSTVIGDQRGAVATIEHLMAALRGLSIDNAVIEVEGGEIPIMDGSSAAFVEAFDEAGVKQLGAARRYLRVLKAVRVAHETAFAELVPHDEQRFDVTIDFPDPTIGRQSIAFTLTPDVFREDLCRARTFGFMREVEGLWAAGYALGASLENTVALDETGVVNSEGLRFADEFVRHKALDAVGDLSLAGAPILGLYRSVKGGHRLNVAMLDALFADPEAYEIVDTPAFAPRFADSASYRQTGYAAPSAVPMPAFSPDNS
ncbi:MAG: UDP-3-O-acyl-N-acetylglucosamine deacetylase [Pseudomonadota bacterium]